jgi:RNA polymerase sigma factor (sigma-70 family)
MEDEDSSSDGESRRGEARRRLEAAYSSEKPLLIARLRAKGRSLEEAEDFVHDLYAEVMGRLSLVARIVNLPAWINSLFARRLIDAWRHELVRAAAGETELAEGLLEEVIAGIGLDPLDDFVRSNLVDALYSALRALPQAQRDVVEAQVFKGMSFGEIAEASGESIDTLKARKRYALRNLSRALRQWIEE